MVLPVVRTPHAEKRRPQHRENFSSLSALQSQISTPFLWKISGIEERVRFSRSEGSTGSSSPSFSSSIERRCSLG